jgi:tetratricopeptide (TPR) repeat protein
MLCVYGASLLSRADMTRQLGQASAYLLEGDKDSTDVLGNSTYFTGKALRAVYLYRLERYREAVKLFEEVFKNRRVKLVYNNSAAYRPFYYFAGIAKLRTGDKREAMKYFDNVIALFAGYETETLEFYFYRGSINYYKGRYKEALSDYERALEINPENESVIHNIRKCEKKLSDGK